MRKPWRNRFARVGMPPRWRRGHQNRSDRLADAAGERPCWAQSRVPVKHRAGFLARGLGLPDSPPSGCYGDDDCRLASRLQWRNRGGLSPPSPLSLSLVRWRPMPGNRLLRSCGLNRSDNVTLLPNRVNRGVATCREAVESGVRTERAAKYTPAPAMRQIVRQSRCSYIGC